MRIGQRALSWLRLAIWSGPEGDLCAMKIRHGEGKKGLGCTLRSTTSPKPTMGSIDCWRSRRIRGIGSCSRPITVTENLMWVRRVSQLKSCGGDDFAPRPYLTRDSLGARHKRHVF